MLFEASHQGNLLCPQKRSGYAPHGASCVTSLRRALPAHLTWLGAKVAPALRSPTATRAIRKWERSFAEFVASLLRHEKARIARRRHQSHRVSIASHRDERVFPCRAPPREHGFGEDRSDEAQASTRRVGATPFCSAGAAEAPEWPEEKEYKVTVTDEAGNAVPYVWVKFTEGKRYNLVRANKDGLATYKCM